MSLPVLPGISGKLKKDMKGIWWLLSREDWTRECKQIIDHVLGPDPLGILSYADTHFAAQFMKRNRNENSNEQSFATAKNNTGAVNGYDAYFGIYEVNEETGQVKHTLLGSISPANTGITVVRDLRVNDNVLIIQLETTATTGEAVTRTLTWKRIS